MQSTCHIAFVTMRILSLALCAKSMLTCPAATTLVRKGHPELWSTPRSHALHTGEAGSYIKVHLLQMSYRHTAHADAHSMISLSS